MEEPAFDAIIIQTMEEYLGQPTEVDDNAISEAKMVDKSDVLEHLSNQKNKRNERFLKKRET